MKDRKGFTLIELVLYVAIASILLLAIAGVIYVISDYYNANSGEFIIQSNVRHAMQKISAEVRKATVTFIVTKDDYTGLPTDLTPGWNYIGLNEAGTDIVQYIYDPVSTTHKMRSLAQSDYGTKYTLKLSKDHSNDDHMVSIDLSGELADLDKTGNHDFSLTTKAEATNTYNIFTRETAYKPGVAIAYKTDPIPKGIRIRIGFVLDSSGSMGDPLGSTGFSRIAVLKDKSKKLMRDLSEIGVVDASLGHFDHRDREHTGLVDLKTNLAYMEGIINTMTPGGATNMGDSFRFVAHTINDAPMDSEVEYKQYYVLLTDGLLNFSTYIDGSSITDYPVANETNVRVRTGWDLVGGSWVYSDRPFDFVERVYQTYHGNIDKVYVIGFATGPGQASAFRIAGICGGTNVGGTYDNYYPATDDEELERVFDEIRSDIAKEVWYVMGP